MANTKISDESAASNLTGGELLLGVQSAANVKITVDQIANRALSTLSWKQTVVAATITDGTISSAYANGQVIDGVTLTTGDRILIKNQAAPAQNGVYVVPASGTPARAPDAGDGAGLLNASVYVSKGTTQADTQWVCTTDGPILPGTTGLTFSQVGAGGAPGVSLTFTSDTGSTADADGSNGVFRWNNATQASATVLFFDNLTKDGVSTTTLFASLPTASGLIMVGDAVDTTKWQVWKWSAITAGSGYYKFTVTLQASSGSLANSRTVCTLFIPLGGGGGGLTNFTESTNTASPNGTVNANQLLVVAASANADVVLAPKGYGAFLRHLPDSTTTGGNKRGQYAVDLLGKRNAADQVASGDYSVVIGGSYNKASAGYSIIVGGSSNLASGSSSFIGGGQSCTASANYTVIGGGQNNSTSATNATVGGGYQNVASGQYSSIAGGRENTSLGYYAAIPGGYQNTADGSYATVLGKRGNTFGIAGVVVESSDYVSNSGDAQRMRLTLSKSTTNATATVLVSQIGSPSSSNQLMLQNAGAMTVTGIVIARQNTTGDTKSWTFSASIKRGANAAATAMVASCTPTVVANDSGAASWALAVTADTTLGCLKVEVTGEASKTIRWVACVDAAQVLY